MPHSLFDKLHSESWINDKLLRYCPWGNESHVGKPMIWRTGQNPGTLEPFSTTAWSIHTGLPRNAPCRSIHYFSDGFSIFYERNEILHELHLAALHPRAVVIHCTEVIHPEIISVSGELKEEENRSSLRLEGETIYLQTRETESGCQILLTSEVDAMPVNMKPSPGLEDQDIAAGVTRRFDKRAVYWSLLETSLPEHAALHTSIEALLYALRDTEGLFNGIWIEDGHSNRMTLNHLMAQVSALSWIDPQLAFLVIRTAAGLQTADGRLSAFSGSEPSTQAKTAAWPQICRTAAGLLDFTPDGHPLKRLVPKLHSILLSSLRNCYDADRNLYLWASEDQAFLPDLYDETLSTVDCPSMLFAEIEAYRRILEVTHMESEMDLSELEKHHQRLEKSITGFYAHAKSGTYRDRIIEGDPIKRLTLSSVTPLFTSLPTDEIRSRLQKSLLSEDRLLAENGLRDWEPWEDDEEQAPVNLSRQLQFLPSGMTNRFMPDETLALWKQTSKHAVENSSPAVDSSNAQAALHVQIVNLVLQPGKEKEPAKWLAWLEKNRRWIIPVPIILFLVLIFGITAAFQSKRTPPRKTIQALIGLAQYQYQMDEQIEALELLTDLYDSGVKTPAVIHLLAKSSFRAGRYEDAEEFFTSINRQQPNPGTELNIALSVYQQGRLEDAEKLYQDIENKYRDIQPQISERARLCIELLNSGTPPPTQIMENTPQLRR